MNDLVSSASQGSLSTFALSLSGVVLTALVAVVVWLVRDRIAARRRYDATLEKRLQAGSGKMEQLERELRSLQERLIEIAADRISQAQCTSHRAELRCQMDRIQEASIDVRTSIVRLEGRVEEGFRQVSRLLMGLVRVPGGPEEGG